MKTFEFEGKNTEEAIENASRELNIPVEELDIDVIEPGSAGIFGLVGSRKTKIKVIVKGETLSEEHESDDPEGLTIAEKTLKDILALIPVESKVTLERADGKISLNIEGDTSGLLIGRKGKTLDALQYIVNRVVNNRLDKRVRVVIDSENYRQRRVESLTQLALKMGDKAKKIKKPVSTNPLNPHDRRIVHLTLKKDQSLDTRSRGEGLLKRVVIFPKIS